MNPYLEQVKKEILSGVNPQWNKDQKLRYVYMKAGKYLTKNAAFFYSLSGKLKEMSLTFEQLKEKYVLNQVSRNEVICKSTSLFLKDIYEELGIEVKLMKSDEYEQIFSEDRKEYLDIYHYFLCCTGENNKKYFLTLSSDLMNIQNNWQTQHFASAMEYHLREVHGKKAVAYQGEPIQETVLSLPELLALDESIGLITDKDAARLPKGGEHFVYYENGVSQDSISLSDSPFVYQRIRGLTSTKSGYSRYLSQNTDFYHEFFLFEMPDGKKLSLSDKRISEFTEKELEAWYTFTGNRVEKIPSNHQEEILKKISIIYEKLKTIRKRALQVPNIKDQEEKETEMARIRKMTSSCYKLLNAISYYFVDSAHKDPEGKEEITTEYLKYRFENLFADFMMFNQEEPSMLSRCNGLAEKLELMDRVLMDLFGGDIFSKIKNDAMITRSVAVDRETEEYHLFFQLNGELYYHLDLDTGKLSIVPDIANYLQNRPFIFISNSFHEQIMDIENQVSKK